MDFNKTLEDLQEKQDKILVLLDNLNERNSQEKRIYDLVDLQNMLHCSKRTIMTWKHDGILPHIQIGNKIWVTQEQLNAFLDQYSKNTSVDFKIRKGGRYDK